MAWFMVGVWAMTDENLCAEAITNVRRYALLLPVFT